MFKAVIAPIQSWLMSKGQCVACGMPLNKGKVESHNATSDKVTCKCGRIFIFDKKQKTSRRALFSEI
jgi:predicted  nucleic acid-binding Zn-ribbon protein